MTHSVGSMKRVLHIALFLCALFNAKAQVNTDHMMQVGKSALYFSDYVLAIKYFNQVINAKPYLADPYFFRGVAKYYLGDYTGAEHDCSEAIERNPFFLTNYEVRSLSNLKRKRYKEAIEDYKVALSYNPEAIGLWHNYALCAKKSNDISTAMSVLDTIRSKAPNYTFAFKLRSEIHLEQGDTLQALANLDSALVIDKYDHHVYMSRAIINLKLKQYKKVDEDLTYAILLSPQCGYYVNRALAREQTGNLNGAMEDYNTAIELDPKNALAHMNRALLREKVGDYNRAIEDYSFVLECVPGHIRARYARALLLKETGDWQGTIDDLTMVLAEFPNFAVGYKLRAEMYHNMGLYEKAYNDERAALQAESSFNTINIAGLDEISSKEEERRKQRKELDDLNNYDQKEIAETPDFVQEYSSEYRGQVQFKDIYVKLQPLFALTYYNNESEVGHIIHYHRYLESINQTSELPLSLIVTASEKALDEKQIAFHFKDIDVQTGKFISESEEAIHYFARGIDFYLVQDLKAATDDFTQAIIADGTLWLSYYARAVARYKQMEMKNADNEGDKHLTSSSPTDFMVDAHLNDYQLILADINKAIDLAPDFAYTYYNRGNVLSQLKDYHAAILSYNEALSLEPNLAEAYYNRGLTYIFLGENIRGVADLSKAGELGLYNAYNLIKRFAE